MADRYISENSLIEEIVKIKDLRKLSTKTIGEAISNVHTADVVEVVRCKDCAYRMELDPIYQYKGRTCKVCFIRNKPVSDNGYCNEAIRKEKK